MCGRFTLIANLSVIVQSFGIEELDWEYRPDNNISPGRHVPAVVHDNKRRLVGFRWGLIPSWAKDASIGDKMFNARAETVDVKPSFRSAFKERRCLIIADGFYEWRKQDKKPFHFSLKSGRPFGFAGLYETWLSPVNGAMKTCTIITIDANELVQPIHDRMPVIVPKDKVDHWLDPGVWDRKDWGSILKPYPSEEMKISEGFVPPP